MAMRRGPKTKYDPNDFKVLADEIMKGRRMIIENYFNPGARPNGYYWIRLRWESDWQPAEWDNEIGCWSLIGRKDPVFDLHVQEIGAKFNRRGEETNGTRKT